MNFWDTIRGHELADSLIRYLPRLAPKSQFTGTVPDQDVHDFIKEKVEAGYRYVSHISVNGFTTIILEK